MRLVILAPLMLAACQTAFAPSKQQPINFQYCEEIAAETFDAGKLRYDLCPGYQPDGQPIEIG